VVKYFSSLRQRTGACAGRVTSWNDRQEPACAWPQLAVSCFLHKASSSPRLDCTSRPTADSERSVDVQCQTAICFVIRLRRGFMYLYLLH